MTNGNVVGDNPLAHLLWRAEVLAASTSQRMHETNPIEDRGGQGRGRRTMSRGGIVTGAPLSFARPQAQRCVNTRTTIPGTRLSEEKSRRAPQPWEATPQQRLRSVVTMPASGAAPADATSNSLELPVPSLMSNAASPQQQQQQQQQLVLQLQQQQHLPRTLSCGSLLEIDTLAHGCDGAESSMAASTQAAQLQQEAEDMTSAACSALSGCVLCDMHQASQQHCLQPLVQTQPHLQPPAEGGNLEDLEHERDLLLAAIDSLRQAADAALERAEAAERSEAVAVQRLKAAEKAQVMQQTIEARIKQSIIEEVQAAIRAASSEATSELRAAAEEIKQLRLNGGHHDARLGSASGAAAASLASHGPVLLGRAAAAGGEGRSSARTKIGGFVPKGEAGSRIVATPRCRSDYSTKAAAASAAPVRQSAPDNSGAIQLRKASNQDSRTTEVEVQSLQKELSPCCEATKESPEPETLSVRAVVSKLENLRDASVGCLEERLAPIRVTSARGAHFRGLSAAPEQHGALETRCLSLCSARNVPASADGSGGTSGQGSTQTQPWRGRACGRASTPQLGSENNSRFMRMA
eukprot:CAMPEP_0172822310 /NCGR_PEP_ID=MMETSP1075-20121228/16590_1 /TAXON_ID=2916 /ORGANISM="Ceratium fusus, Strain PA161109" /LENGTH=578 /DNA_ID=CAMNT_0013663289 /DNA_START=53 /DNA_END=1789 /DNA_ORIENTATION=+